MVPDRDFGRTRKKLGLTSWPDLKLKHGLVLSPKGCIYMTRSLRLRLGIMIVGNCKAESRNKPPNLRFKSRMRNVGARS